MDAPSTMFDAEDGPHNVGSCPLLSCVVDARDSMAGPLLLLLVWIALQLKLALQSHT